MPKRTSLHGWPARAAILALIIAAGFFFLPVAEQPDPWKSPGGPKLVAIHELPDSGQFCEPSYFQVPEDTNLFGALGAESVLAGAQQSGAGTVLIDRDPVRQIRDLAPIYGAVGVNTNTNEVILGDANFWSIRVFNRTDSTPPGAPFTEPKRVIRGVNAQIQFINGMYIDPKKRRYLRRRNRHGKQGYRFQSRRPGQCSSQARDYSSPPGFLPGSG